jgi:hypothetical protein
MRYPIFRDGEHMDIVDLRSAAASLRGDNVKPLCARHEPKASLQREGRGFIVFIHCSECKFTAWMHPNSYYDMMVDNMIEEVEEDIKERG